jgi:ParB/RepB/Spo0J family partition protein
MSKLVALPPPVVLAPADQAIIADDLLTEGYRDVPLYLVRISYTNRTRFNPEALQQLADSIAEVGILQPIVMRPVVPTAAAPQILEIVAGERRFRAAVLAGLSKAPASIRVLTDKQAAEIQLLENIQRENPHPLEEAIGFEQLMLQHGYNADQLAARVKQSRSYVYARLKLCALSLKAREMFLDDVKRFPASTALLIARIPTPDLQDKALNEIMAPQHNGEPMSVRQAALHIASRYTLELVDAPFDVKDAKLLASAGNCVKCPKRTGNQPEIYADAKSADVCTDPDCFAEKKAAHYQRVIVVANKSGIPVLEGEEAKNITAKNWSRDAELVTVDHHLSAFDRVSPATGMAGTVKKHLAEVETPSPAKYIKREDGSVEAAYYRADIQAALEKAGACESESVHQARIANEPSTGKPTAAAVKKQQEKADKERLAAEITSQRVALYREIRSSTHTGFSLEMFREIAKLLVREHALPDDLIGDLYSFEDRSDAGVCAYIDQAEYAQIQMIVLDLLIGEFLSVQHWEVDRLEDNYGVDTLQALAKLEGLDPTKDYRQLDISPTNIVAECQTDEATASEPVTPATQATPTSERAVLKLKTKADSPAQHTTGPTIKVKKNRALSVSLAERT